jgi:hypothetical protein
VIVQWPDDPLAIDEPVPPPALPFSIPDSLLQLRAYVRAWIPAK